MKFGQLIEYNRRNIFLQNYSENEAGWLVPDLFLSFEKAWYGLLLSSVASFLMVGQLDYKTLVSLFLFKYLLNLDE